MLARRLIPRGNSRANSHWAATRWRRFEFRILREFSAPTFLESPSLDIDPLKAVAVNVKTPLTLLVLVLILAGAVLYGWQSLAASTSSSVGAALSSPTPTGPTCTKVKHLVKGQRVRAVDVVVNVYNSGNITGLASATMSRLTQRGFRQGIVADAPRNISATNVTLLTKTRRAPEVRLVSQQFHKPINYRRHDLGAGIDVVLGNGFHGLAAHAKPFLVVQKSVRTCARTSSATP